MIVPIGKKGKSRPREGRGLLQAYTWDRSGVNGRREVILKPLDEVSRSEKGEGEILVLEKEPAILRYNYLQ